MSETPLVLILTSLISLPLLMSTSPSGVGPAMMVVVSPLAAVAKADPKATPPKAPATRTEANISFKFVLFMVILRPQLLITARAAAGTSGRHARDEVRGLRGSSARHLKDDEGPAIRRTRFRRFSRQVAEPTLSAPAPVRAPPRTTPPSQPPGPP